MSLQISVAQVTPFVENCYLLLDDDARVGVAIDPGGEVDAIVAAMEKMGGEFKEIWITHGHLDHIGAAAQLSRRIGARALGPGVGDEFLVNGLRGQQRRYGWPETEPYVPAKWLQDGDRLSFGAFDFDVLAMPGHTPGHVCFSCPAAQIVFTGDCLFAGSVGRSDFEGGDGATLIRSIRSKLLALPEETTVLPGHGPATAIGIEKASNPFLS